jgi:L-malate glycosyltransferase
MIMLNVLYLLNHAGKAGTESYVYSLIERLNNNGVKAYFAYNEEGFLVDRLKNMGIETYNLNMKSPFDIGAAFKIKALCKKLNIDIIHTHYLRENYIALWSKLLKNKVKVIYTSHFIQRNNFPTRICNRFLTLFESKVIAVCNRGKDMLAYNGINRDKIDVIYNGVDINQWKEPFESKIREKYNILDDEFIFSCASRFAHDKGHKFLVESVPLLKKMTNKKFRLLLAGDGPFLEEIKALVKKLSVENEVIFVGFLDNIKELFYGSDSYVNSSEHEALSFLIVEALASGLPTIVTNMAGNVDIVNEETKCGLLVEYNNSQSMANAMLKMMRDEGLRNSLTKNAKKAVFERFNLDVVIDKTFAIYKGV